MMDLTQIYPTGVPFWFFLMAIITVIVHLAFSAAVFNDAPRLKENDAGPEFVGPWLWCLAVLGGGLIAAVADWLIHYSAISRR